MLTLVTVVVALLLTGCSREISFTSASILGLDAVVHPVDLKRVNEYATLIGTRHRLTLAVQGIDCREKGAESVFAIDKFAEAFIKRAADAGYHRSAAIVLCRDTRLLSVRYSDEARTHAQYSGLINTLEVRKIQQLALSQPSAALTEYLKLVEQKFVEPGMLMSWPAIIVAGVGKKLEFERESYVFNALLMNVARGFATVSTLFRNPWAALAGVLLLASLVRWVAMKVPPLLLQPLSPRLSKVVGFVAYVAIECIWTIPVIGVLNAMGGGMLDNQWIMASLTRSDISSIYDLVFSANATVEILSPWFFIPLSLAVVGLGSVLFVVRMGAISSMSPRGIDLASKLGLLTWYEMWILARAAARTDKNLAEANADVMVETNSVGKAIERLIAWALVFSIIPPVVTLFLAARSLGDALDGFFNSGALFRLAQVDKDLATYFDANGQLRRPLPLGNDSFGRKLFRTSLVGLIYAALAAPLVFFGNRLPAASVFAEATSNAPKRGVVPVARATMAGEVRLSDSQRQPAPDLVSPSQPIRDYPKAQPAAPPAQKSASVPATQLSGTARPAAAAPLTGVAVPEVPAKAYTGPLFGALTIGMKGLEPFTNIVLDAQSKTEAEERALRGCSQRGSKCRHVATFATGSEAGTEAGRCIAIHTGGADYFASVGANQRQATERSLAQCAVKTTAQCVLARVACNVR